MSYLKLSKIVGNKTLTELRKILLAIKHHEEYTWEALHSKIKGTGSVNILQNYASKEHDPSLKRLNEYLQFIEKYAQKNPDTSPARLYSKLMTSHLGLAEIDDRYRPFKKMLKITETNQEILSGEISGSYYVVRRNNENRFVIAHTKIADTYMKLGLPICKISRRRIDDSGDFKIAGSVWKKNGHVHIMGYEVNSGHMRNFHITPSNDRCTFGRGVTSGLDPNGIAFCAKIFIVRTDISVTYDKCRYSTGVFEDSEEVRKALTVGGVAKKNIDVMIGTVEENTYIHVPIG